MLVLSKTLRARILSSFPLEIAPSFPLQAIKPSMHAMAIKHGSWCLKQAREQQEWIDELRSWMQDESRARVMARVRIGTEAC